MSKSRAIHNHIHRVYTLTDPQMSYKFYIIDMGDTGTENNFEEQVNEDPEVSIEIDIISRALKITVILNKHDDTINKV